MVVAGNRGRDITEKSFEMGENENQRRKREVIADNGLTFFYSDRERVENHGGHRKGGPSEG